MRRRKPNPTATPKVAVYCRVSTDEQAASGLGLEAQEERCRALAASRGWEVGAVYTDAGVSGTVDPKARPAASRLLAAVEAGEVSAVLVLRLDRVARRAETIHRTLRELQEAGAGLVSVSEPVDTSSAMGAAFVGIAATFAQLERDLVAERTTLALRAKRARGERTGSVRYGFRLAEDGVSLVEDAGEQATIQTVRALRAEGWTLSAIGDELTRLGMAPRKGNRWHPQSLARMVEAA